jgi:hypothetical protein
MDFSRKKKYYNEHSHSDLTGKLEKYCEIPGVILCMQNLLWQEILELRVQITKQTVRKHEIMLMKIL